MPSDGPTPRDLPGPLRGGTAGASEGQAGRRRSRAQEDLCPAAPGGQSHGGIAPQRRREHQRLRSAQDSLGNPGAQTGVSAIAQRAAMLPLADSEPTPMATLSYGGIFGDNSGGAMPERHRSS